jgi:hypothetical protein
VGLVVTGISQDGNTDALEKTLANAGLSLEPLQLIGPDDSDAHLTDVPAEGHIDTRLMTGGGQGTGVPGLSGGATGLGATRRYFRNESLSDRLGDLDIPDSEIENYLEALEAGRSIVAYFAHPDTLAKVEEIFRASGLAKIKTF